MTLLEEIGNVKTIIMADKKYEEHMMYDAKKAETQKEHLELKEKGYGHSKSGFKLREVHYAGPLKCWKSHERKPGTTEGAKGSCQHKDPTKRPK
tara:strand:- start:3 stop:284 length:282 start_codon:yes stop_codon:yes gene_type:complete